MSRTQTFVTVGFGAYFAAVLYLKLAMEPGQMFSHTAFGIVVYLALLAIPAIFVALNIGRKSIWTVVSALALMVGMFVWICLNALVAGLPGSEWVDRGQMNSLLAMPALSTVALPLRLKAAIPILGMAFFASFVLITVGLPISMRYLLDKQIQATHLKGGCVESATRANIASAHDVQFGWFVGSSSEQILFVEKHAYFKWSYSSFGIAMRRDIPVAFQPNEQTNVIKCLSTKSL